MCFSFGGAALDSYIRTYIHTDIQTYRHTNIHLWNMIGHPICYIVRFMDYTAVVRCIINNEFGYTQEVLEGWCRKKQPLHQNEEDKGHDLGLQNGQTPPVLPCNGLLHHKGPTLHTQFAPCNQTGGFIKSRTARMRNSFYPEAG